ncbi:MAG: ribonuclease R [bacterium]
MFFGGVGIAKRNKYFKNKETKEKDFLFLDGDGKQNKKSNNNKNKNKNNNNNNKKFSVNKDNVALKFDESKYQPEYIQGKKDKIFEFVDSEIYKPVKTSDIISLLEVPENEQSLFVYCINELINEAKLYKTKKNKIVLAKSFNIFTGTFSSNPKGFGFVILDDCYLDDDGNKPEDIFIPKNDVNGAMHKDRVICQVTKSSFNDNNKGATSNIAVKRSEGFIVNVVQKGYNVIVGVYEESKNFGFVIPDEKKLFEHIFVPKKASLGAVSGHKVIVEIVKNFQDNKKPEGKIVEILGHINDPGVDILSIIKQYEIPIDFEEDVYSQIETIPDEVLEKEKTNRLDIRNLQTVTIDGDDAKDLDDAITIEKLSNGNFKLGVHIADVTHYVKSQTALDREAIKRGTSVYLVDRVIPMLPHKLSNGLCSLNANVDRLALSCIMEIDPTGDVVGQEIAETLINVDKRMSYNIVADALENINDDSNTNVSDNKDFLEMFQNMKTLRDILRDKRTKRGSIDFDFPEVKVILDENRKPIELKIYERNVATSIIEEFMLLANETVAEVYFYLEMPFVYRSHAEPDVEKLEKMSDFIAKFGYSLNKAPNIKVHSKDLQKILQSCKGTPEEQLISTVMLRSFKQARYTSTNDGHFGLSAKYYCHFTSPIRRYPDLQIHRIIKQNLNNQLSQSKIETLKTKMPDIATNCSTRERIAEEAERETITIKKIEYMLDKLGQSFTGIISGVTSWGIYVKLENTVEGMVTPKLIQDDNYVYDENNLCYLGENTNKVYTLGDTVEVLLVNASKKNQTIDFKFVD